jgi:ribonuclease HI
MSAIIAFESLTEPHSVTLYSESEYLIRAFNDGRLDKWQNNGWQIAQSKQVSNKDLWLRLLESCSLHSIEWVYASSRVGGIDQKRCDELAKKAAKQLVLPADEVYEK